jgi:PA domain
MRTPFVLLVATAFVAAAPQWGDWHGKPLPPVSSEALQSLVSVDELVAGAAQLQAFADAHEGTRVMGGPGHNDTVNWLYGVLSSTGYYDVSFQEFVALYSGGSASFTANGEETPVELMTYTPNGEGSGPLVAVNNLGCEPTDFPAEVEGAIALVSRGECTFSIKASNAFTAGAIGCVIYDNRPSRSLVGTLGDPDIDYSPTVGMTQENGEALLALLEAGPVDATIFTNVIEENRTTYNVLAETRQGDHGNVLVLGGHTGKLPEQSPLPEPGHVANICKRLG